MQPQYLLPFPLLFHLSAAPVSPAALSGSRDCGSVVEARVARARGERRRAAVGSLGGSMRQLQLSLVAVKTLGRGCQTRGSCSQTGESRAAGGAGGGGRPPRPPAPVRRRGRGPAAAPPRPFIPGASPCCLAAAFWPCGAPAGQPGFQASQRDAVGAAGANCQQLGGGCKTRATLGGWQGLPGRAARCRSSRRCPGACWLRAAGWARPGTV